MTTPLDPTERERFSLYARELLQIVTYQANEGIELVFAEDEDEDEDSDVDTFFMNPFELFAFVTGEEGFGLEFDAPLLTLMLAKALQLHKDCGGWYYFPLGEETLEFLETQAWMILYDEWLARRKAKAIGVVPKKIQRD